MTHSEALQHDRLGFPGRDCPGVLVATGTYLVHGHGPPGEQSEVTTYTCTCCEHALSIEGTGRVLNCYRVPTVPALVRSLAAREGAGPPA